MVTISLCMIVKNEEDVLERCLNSIQDAVDEIIIVDTGSTDQTKEIADSFTDKVFDFKWVNDFSKARNYAFSKATKDYCMWLDADDVVLEQDRNNLRKLKEELDPSIDIVLMKYHVGFNENGESNFSYYRERIIKNDGRHRWVSPIHEVIPMIGKTLYSEIGIIHKKVKATDPNRNITIFEDMLEQKIELDARQVYYYARELYYHQRYQEAIERFNQFLNREDGWKENKIEACQLLAKCYEALQEEKKRFESLLRSFYYDSPRAEIDCEIGNYFFDKREYRIAIYWYQQALSNDSKERKSGFIQSDCYDYIPLLQLCICFDRLHEVEKANMYNELVGQIRPTSKAYLYNKDYFSRILN